MKLMSTEIVILATDDLMKVMFTVGQL